MAKKTFKKGLGSKELAKRDSQKGSYYKDPGSRISYVRQGIMRAFTPKEGKNRVRIIQPFELEELNFYGMEVHFHRGVGNEGDPGFGDYLCIKRMKPFFKKAYDITIKGNCYECDQQTSELWDENPDLAKTFYPDRRMWFFVHDLMGNDPSEVLWWSCPWTLHEEILSRSSDEETSVYRDVSDPFTGSPVSFERSGKGKLTKYTNVQIFKAEHPLDEKVLDQIVEFRELLIVPTYEQVKAAAEGEEYVGGETATDSTGDDGSVDDNDDGAGDDDGAEDNDSNEQGDDTADCFGKEYDKWEECSTCHRAEDCKPKPKKEEKPKRTPKSTKTAKSEETAEESKPTDNAQSDDETNKKREEIREKIRKAKAERASRN